MKIMVFDIGGTAIKYGVWTKNALYCIHEIPTEAHLGGEHIMERVSSLLLEEEGFDGIGISTAGQVNADTGSVIYANRNIPGYTGTKIRSILEERFHVPVMVENDVNSAAIGEAVYGAGKNFASFLCLTYGTGVGGAIVEQKKIYHGSSYSAGEFGAIVTHGPEKLAGEDVFDGCYERYASTSALVRAAMNLDPSLSDGRRIFKRLSEPAVQKLVDAWIDEIVLGLTSIIHIFNPPCVILGGGVMAQPYVLNSIREKTIRYIMPSFSHVQLHSAMLGNTAGLLGIQYLTAQYMEKFLH